MLKKDLKKAATRTLSVAVVAALLAAGNLAPINVMADTPIIIQEVEAAELPWSTARVYAGFAVDPSTAKYWEGDFDQAKHNSVRCLSHSTYRFVISNSPTKSGEVLSYQWLRPDEVLAYEGWDTDGNDTMYEYANDNGSVRFEVLSTLYADDFIKKPTIEKIKAAYNYAAYAKVADEYYDVRDEGTYWRLTYNYNITYDDGRTYKTLCTEVQSKATGKSYAAEYRALPELYDDEIAKTMVYSFIPTGQW